MSTIRWSRSARRAPGVRSPNKFGAPLPPLALPSLILLWALATFSWAQQEVVKIGFASPLTGPQAHYGQDNLDGARLAVDELNARAPRIGQRPVRFELVAEDDQADPRIGTVVAQRLVDAGVRGVVGHFNSGVSIPASKIYADAGIPQLSVSTAVRYTRQGHRTAFRLMADDGRQGAALGRYATGRLGLKRLAVVDDRTAYGQGLADAFAQAARAAGGEIVKREYTTDREFDFRAIITSLRAVAPEAVFFAGYDAQAGPLARQMRELKLAVPLLGGETMHTAKFIELAGPAAEGHVASTPGAPLLARPRGREFAERFRARYRREIGLYAPYCYDAVMVLAAAMREAGSSDAARVLAALRNIRHAGVTADIAFDENGDLRQGALSVFRVTGGKWVLQDP